MKILLATLINDQGCYFDRIELSSLQKIKEWAKHRGGSYTLDVYNVMQGAVQFRVKNNRFFEVKR